MKEAELLQIGESIESCEAVISYFRSMVRDQDSRRKWLEDQIRPFQEKLDKLNRDIEEAPQRIAEAEKKLQELQGMLESQKTISAVVRLRRKLRELDENEDED